MYTRTVTHMCFDSKFAVKLGGFQFQLETFYVCSYTEVCLWVTECVYFYTYVVLQFLISKNKISNQTQFYLSIRSFV